MPHAKLSFTPISGAEGGTVTDSVPSDVASARPVPARDFDGLYKALSEAHPRDALHLLCGARLDGRAVILDGPTVPR